MEPEQRITAEQAITNAFMWNFVTGDNIIYNYETMWSLYEAMSNEPKAYRKQYYWKPITLLIASIIECIFHDFNNRVQQRVRDPLPNITTEVVEDFKIKNRIKIFN